MRRTKIVATIGPACETKEKIEEMIEAGVDVFRFNMKHATVEWHSEKMGWVEQVCKKMGVRVGMLLDLQGPEVRIDGIDEAMRVEKGQRVKFVAPGNEGIWLDHPQIFAGLKKGQVVYADDGFLEFVVVEASKEMAVMKVVEGESIKPRKTVNFPGMHLDFQALVEKDLENLSLASRHHVDFVALSFVRSGADVQMLRKELMKMKVEGKIISKIEHPDAIEKFDEVLAESDGIMVARGDLGIEYPMEEVPGLQKMMVRRCREEGKPVIVATQMLESMIENIRPTRAEVSDVANAVYDSADAVMTSGETASGKYPVRAVKTMARIIEKVDESCSPGEIAEEGFGGDQTSAMLKVASELVEYGDEYKALVVLTESGRKARCLSRLRPKVPIVALSREDKTVDQLKLSWGVVPCLFEYKKVDRVSKLKIGEFLQRQGVMGKRGKFVLVYGNVEGDSGKTSVVRVMEVG